VVEILTGFPLFPARPQLANCGLNRLDLAEKGETSVEFWESPMLEKRAVFFLGVTSQSFGSATSTDPPDKEAHWINQAGHTAAFR